MKSARPQIAHFVIGDIHGCYDQLIELEQRILEYCVKIQRRPLVVLVGDLIDRGPSSLSVVRHVMEGCSKGTYRCVAGNHEAIFMELVAQLSQKSVKKWVARCEYTVPLDLQHALSSQAQLIPFQDFVAWRRQMWLMQGGAETLESFGENDQGSWSFAQFEHEIRFLASLPLVYKDDIVTVSHALAAEQSVSWAFSRSTRCFATSKQPSDTSVTPQARAMDSLTAEEVRLVQELLWSRECESEWPEELPHHVSGHTPHDEVVWMEDGKRLQLDTGCVYGNKLTAWCPQTRAFIQVKGPAAPEL